MASGTTSARRDELLIEPEALAAQLKRARRGPALLDVRWRLGAPPGRDGYLHGHIPSAVYVDLERDLAGPPGCAGRHPLPDPVAFGAAMRAAGVSERHLVVVYDERDSTAAARAWWLLRYFGHGDVRVLDGGLAAWCAARLPLARGEERPLAPGDFQPRPGALALLDADGALRLARDGLLIDARTPERFRGEHEPVDPVPGRVPGARNRPTALNLTADGRFRSGYELRAEFAALGAGQDTAVGAYCGSGVTAAHEVLALALADIPAALYVGSWSEWINDRTRPIARGDTA